jgi:hypothetical protein
MRGAVVRRTGPLFRRIQRVSSEKDVWRNVCHYVIGCHGDARYHKNALQTANDLLK